MARIKTGAPRRLSPEAQQEVLAAQAFDSAKLVNASYDRGRSTCAESVWVSVVQCPLDSEARVSLDHVDRSYCKDALTGHRCGALAEIRIGDEPEVACLFRASMPVEET